VTSKSISHRDKAWVLKARSNLIATRKRRKQWGMLGKCLIKGREASEPLDC
jgi:hypothetical protein